MKTTLASISDTKLLLGYHYGEWTFGPPAIEAGIAACSMAQEEFGHARLLNGILDREFDLKIDPLADTREPNEISSIAALDHPFDKWSQLVAANAVVDHSLSLEISAFNGSTFEPMARIVPKMLLEEKFHYAHAEGWVQLIEAQGGAPCTALHRALARAVRDATAFFGPPGHDADLVAEGVKNVSDDDLRQRLFARLAKILEDPSAIGLVADGEKWAPEETIEWETWDAARRRIDSSGPDSAILDELRGTKNVAFKTA